MPQMYPMEWLIIYFSMITIFFMSYVIIFFVTLNKNTPKNTYLNENSTYQIYKTLKKNSFKWKW
uniref:ATP synthase F0 subunit 8 n=1 Tax=Agenocimbex maculatus TaxID=2507170 RepID=A0A977TJ65_9HYME|nr:ATP synthase F0 subunit 8 [Agenocimbex maculatus]